MMWISRIDSGLPPIVVPIRKLGKHLTFYAKDQKQIIRLRSLGAGYSEDEIKAVLSDKKAHTPKCKRNPLTPDKNRLLIDIDAKIQKGKGMGYQRWAKVFNLKQMAQTVAYLQEHNLLDYDDLIAKSPATTARLHAPRCTDQNH